jgi:OPA family glycerol-3-phosphate transporter-like MFS transporter 1/2
MFVLLGLVQSVDFPALVSTMGNWTQRKTRGFVTGVWATCSNTGNIIGMQSAALILFINGNQWEHLLYYVTAIYIFFAILIYCAFVPSPRDVDLLLEEETPVPEAASIDTSTEDIIEVREDERISLLQAICLPRVLLYGFCFFCIKFSIYSLLLWIPMFMEQSLGKTNKEIADVQTFYEIGAAIGSILLGYFTDKFYSRRSPVIILSVVCATLISFAITFGYQQFS